MAAWGESMHGGIRCRYWGLATHACMHAKGEKALRVPASATHYVPMQAWTGSVTQIIPPNYGIIDGSAFYVHAIVQGGRLPQVGVGYGGEGGARRMLLGV